MKHVGYLLKYHKNHPFSDKERYKTDVISSKHKIHFLSLPMMSRKSSARTTGPLSMGFPDPLNTRPVKQ